ncbi:MAG: hypothetical protein AAFS02_10420 [Pseudomonadota bacterium]
MIRIAAGAVAALFLGCWFFASANADVLGAVEQEFKKFCKLYDGDDTKTGHWACSDKDGFESWQTNTSQKWLILSAHCSAMEKRQEDRKERKKCDVTVPSLSSSDGAVAVLNHETGHWYCPPNWSCNAEIRSVGAKPFGEAALLVPSRRSVGVLVANTNPLLYGGQLSKISTSDAGSLSDLAALGKAVTGAATALLQSEPSLQPFEMKEDWQITFNSVETESGATKCELVAGKYINDVAKSTGDVRAVGKKAREAILELLSATADLAAAYDSALEFVQQVELSSPLIDGAVVYRRDKAWRDLEIDSKVRGVAAIRAKAAAILGALPDRSAEDLDECRSMVPLLLAKLTAADTQRESLREELEGFRAKSLELVEKGQPIRNLKARLLLFERKLDEVFYWSDDKNVSSSDVPRYVIVRQGFRSPPTIRERKATFTIERSSPLAKEVTAQRPESIEASLALSSPIWQDLSFGVALMYTDLASPEFGAVADPGNSGALVIDQTGEDSQAGNLAVVAEYKIVKRLCDTCPEALKNVSLQAGAILSDDNFGYLYGLSYTFNDYVSLGVGRTRQQVDVLSGQTIGSTVASNDDIRTRETFRSDTYIALRVSFGTFKFFSR